MGWRMDEKAYLVDLIESSGLGSREYYYNFPIDEEPHQYCFIDLVSRKLSKIDLELEFESAPDTELVEYVGIGSERDKLRTGDKIVRNAVKWKVISKAEGA